jgi:uncharacterized repeat protein (TIGR02543 family)
VTIPSTASTGTDLDPDEDYVVGDVTMTTTNGTNNNPRVWKTSTSLELRFYSGSTITFSVPNGYKIKSITCNTTSNFSITSPTGGSWSSSTWYPANATSPTSVVLSGSSSTAKLTSVVVTYESTGFYITYDGNGKTSGTVPTDNTKYSSGASVTVLGNTGELVRTGCTFAGWNTKADGTGTNYAADETFSISANTTLYAKWTATVKWIVGNTTVRTDENIVIPDDGKSVTPPADPTTEAPNCGDKFMGWTTTNIGAVGLTDAAAISALNLFTGATNVTGNTTFYAVFADYGE